jgi:hypothetical protein
MPHTPHGSGGTIVRYLMDVAPCSLLLVERHTDQVSNQIPRRAGGGRLCVVELEGWRTPWQRFS